MYKILTFDLDTKDNNYDIKKKYENDCFGNS